MILIIDKQTPPLGGVSFSRWSDGSAPVVAGYDLATVPPKEKRLPSLEAA
ncbi:MAG TPA: hypothetical protein VMV91_12270 [Rhodocyclaceae bacterium]|nr:hypothetical protein [Sulfuricella sp.]HUW38098.1 hypothetical protein [Rhodocyclaceae bacterium]HUX62930.1 hypothetical protein [Sulfuricella sp.]